MVNTISIFAYDSNEEFKEFQCSQAHYPNGEGVEVSLDGKLLGFVLGAIVPEIEDNDIKDFEDKILEWVKINL